MSKIVENDVVEMLVGRTTNVHNLAVAIQRVVKDDGHMVRLVGIGANAVNQMGKGAAKSRSFLAAVGKDILWKIYFTDRTLTEEEMAEMLERTGETKEKISALVFESALH